MTVTMRPITTGPLPVSPAAWSALRAEIERGPNGATDRPDRDIARRHDVIADLLRDVTVVDDAGVAAIGRRVTFREVDGVRTTVALVIPGDGDPRHDWISVDAPLGRALLGARAGEAVTVRAPAGDRVVHVEAVA
jgi:transcription elongation GreA/GreB family factor